VPKQVRNLVERTNDMAYFAPFARAGQ
jgi:hypothetical protein